MSRKQIARSVSPSGNVVTLNKYSNDHRDRHYVVFVDRRAVFKTSIRDAAKKKFLDLSSGVEDAPQPVRLDDWAKAAEEVQTHAMREVEHPTFPLLCALYVLRLRTLNRSPGHVKQGARLSNLVGPAPVPSEPEALEVWLTEATQNVLEGVRSKSTQRLRASIFLSIFRHALKTYPLAFRKLTGRILQIEASVVRFELRRKTPLREVKHYAPMSRREVDELITSVTSFEAKASLLAYFAGGFRAGEPERISRDLIQGDQLDIATVQNKTKGRRKTADQCYAPVVLRTIVNLFAAGWPSRPRVTKVNRCRATAATWLSLCGLSTLEITTRLGHTSRKMSDEHYVRPEFVRAVLDGARDATGALWLYDGDEVEFEFPGAPPETAWDRWLLFRLLWEARALNRLDEIKKLVNEAVGQNVVVPVPKRVVSF